MRSDAHANEKKIGTEGQIVSTERCTLTSLTRMRMGRSTDTTIDWTGQFKAAGGGEVVFSLQLPPGCPISKLARTRQRTNKFVHNKKSYRSVG
tara:strand:+ start:764 stop:1042 length:279 start_codon:yes stop_codon:yes gene_type:complete